MKPETKERLLTPDQLVEMLPVSVRDPCSRIDWYGAIEEQQKPRCEGQFDQPSLTHHQIIFYVRPSSWLYRSCGKVERQDRPPPGSFSIIPAGAPSRWRWHGEYHLFNFFISPALLDVAPKAGRANATGCARTPGGCSRATARRRAAGGSFQ